MQRYFIHDMVELNQLVRLNRENSHHLKRVMRGQVGDQCILIDSQPKAFIAEITNTTGDSVQLRAVEKENRLTEMPVQITIASGLLKNDKMDWLVQKATETGMHQFIPLHLQRNITKWPANKKNQRIERLSKIAKEAAEQSHRLVCPTICQVQTIESLVSLSKEYDHSFILYEELAKEGQHSGLELLAQNLQNGQRILAVFGPEGGLAIEEVEQLEAAQFQQMSLGPRILRAETAPIYFLSVISYITEILSTIN